MKTHFSNDMETIRNHEKHRKDTELEIAKCWRFKEHKEQLEVQCYILKRGRPTKRTGICYLCLNEKLFTIEHQRNDVLNQRNELFSNCRHRNKFKLMNHKTWPLRKKCPCAESFYWWEFFSRYRTECGKSQEQINVFVQNEEKCSSDQPRMWTLFTHLTLEHCYVILISLHRKFTVISVLNHFKDMKLVVSTHVALLH